MRGSAKKSQEENYRVFTPQYTITNAIVKNLTTIERLKAKIEQARILPHDEIRLRKEAIVSMVHHSTAIEGNTLREYQVAQVLAGKKVAASKRELYEVENYRKALNYITDIVKQKHSITLETVLRLHALTTHHTLDKANSGRLRKEPVYVVQRQFGVVTKVLYTGPEAQKVPLLVKDLIAWIGKTEAEDISPIIAAGIAHAEFAAIHPFTDGNGRTARLLATLILYQRGYDFRKLFALEEYYNRNRQAYYNAIHLGDTYEERKSANMTEWLAYFAGGFKVAMEAVLKKVDALALSPEVKPKEQLYLDKNERLAVDFLISHGKLYRQDVEDITGLSESSALRLLEKLRKAGLVKKRGSGRSAYYASP